MEQRCSASRNRQILQIHQTSSLNQFTGPVQRTRSLNQFTGPVHCFSSLEQFTGPVLWSSSLNPISSVVQFWTSALKQSSGPVQLRRNHKVSCLVLVSRFKVSLQNAALGVVVPHRNIRNLPDRVGTSSSEPDLLGTTTVCWIRSSL